MTDPTSLERDAVAFAARAVECDKNGLTDTAAEYYMKAAEALLCAKLNGLSFPDLEVKANQYLSRAEALKANPLEASAFSAAVGSKSPLQSQTDRARFLLSQGLEEDEMGNTQEAYELYLQAAELCVKLKQESNDKDFQSKLAKMATQALDRAEHLKRLQDSSDASSSELKSSSRAGSTRPVARPLGDALREDSTCQSSSHRPSAPPTGPRGPPSGGGYTKEEIQVLKATSVINGRQYVPFLDIDLKERFAYPVPFSDKDGFLALSKKQRDRFNRWVRPDDRCTDPQLIYTISSFSIKQTIVSDCSFVASLAISAAYEKRFKKKILTTIIYPQNRHGEPQYNPCGKYMIKLNLNGVHRKVIIDDYLPVGREGELLCSYSNNNNELWVSLLEKAYMKVMGGYDFPGSNSNIDLHALTGWIPERVALRPDAKTEFDADKEFERLRERFHRGDCLITAATGEMSDADADRAGLVPTHAYAVLDIQKIKNYRLLQLKNPWSHLRWHGNWSEKDSKRWTPEMMKLLNFDPKSAELYDNGVFWIDYESVLRFYDVFYINWNPSLFGHTSCTHHTWTAKEGPKKDVYSVADNPQFRLELKGKGPCAVWVLLTRHITDKDDFANNREFITLLVYNKSAGRRVFYPYDPPPYKDGVRINSPHYLCKMVEDIQGGSNTYTLVVSQYEKNNTIHFTLRVYATCEFRLNRIAEPYNPKFEKQVTGKWEGKFAGGCANYRETFTSNPVYQLTLDNSSTDNMILVELKGPKQFSVGFQVTKVSENVSGASSSITKESSGTYKPGYCYLELDHLPGGIYHIMATTFYPKEEGPFILSVSSSSKISLTRVQ